MFSPAFNDETLVSSASDVPFLGEVIWCPPCASTRREGTDVGQPRAASEADGLAGRRQGRR